MGVLGPRDFKSLVSTNFTIRANGVILREMTLGTNLRILEAGVGIEPAYTALQAAA